MCYNCGFLRLFSYGFQGCNRGIFIYYVQRTSKVIIANFYRTLCKHQQSQNFGASILDIFMIIALGYSRTKSWIFCETFNPIIVEFFKEYFLKTFQGYNCDFMNKMFNGLYNRG